jgi:hypothetical protein
MSIATNYCVIIWYSGHRTMTVGTLLCVFLTFGNLGLNVSHAMLAEKCANAKHRAVNTLEQQQDQVELPASHQTAFKCLFYLNIALPVIYAVVDYFSYKYYFAHLNVVDGYSVMLNTMIAICNLLMNGLLIISGVILVTTVFAIRRFYKQRNAMDALDTGALVRHASAFALFLLAVLVESIAYAIFEV